MIVASAVVLAAEIYFAIGLLFAILFVWRGAGVIDPAARGRDARLSPPDPAGERAAVAAPPAPLGARDRRRRSSATPIATRRASGAEDDR